MHFRMENTPSMGNTPSMTVKVYWGTQNYITTSPWLILRKHLTLRHHQTRPRLALVTHEVTHDLWEPMKSSTTLAHEKPMSFQTCPCLALVWVRLPWLTVMQAKTTTIPSWEPTNSPTS